MKIIILNFGKWNSSHGRFFVATRIYWRGYRWTPFCWLQKRYDTWFGYWRNEKLQREE